MKRPGRGASSSRNRKGSLANISKVLSKVVGQYGLDQRLKFLALASCWAQTVGEPFGSLSRPLFIDFQGVLVVSAKDASVAQELSFRKDEFMRSIGPLARSLGLRVNSIRFELKHFKEEEEAARPQAPEPEALRDPDDEELAGMTLTGEEAEQLTSLTDGMESEDENVSGYSARIVKLYERELKLRRWRAEHSYPRCGACGSYETRLFGRQRACGVCFAEGRMPGTVNKVQD